VASEKQTVAERIADWDNEDLRSILKEKWGRRFIWRFLKKCGVNHLCLDFENVNHTFFMGGQRNIGNTLLAQVLDISEEAYLLMNKEAKKEEKLVAQLLDKETKERKEDDND
jgi:hypothetical protein